MNGKTITQVVLDSARDVNLDKTTMDKLEHLAKPDPVVELDTPTVTVKHAQPGLSVLSTNGTTKLCKNGHILSVGRTTCSFKNCKYAA